jgi:hypothetical protein
VFQLLIETREFSVLEIFQIGSGTHPTFHSVDKVKKKNHSTDHEGPDVE